MENEEEAMIKYPEFAKEAKTYEDSCDPKYRSCARYRTQLFLTDRCSYLSASRIVNVLLKVEQ